MSAAGQRPRIAVTLGDPRGIGPEIAARALERPLDAELIVIGAEDQIAAVPAARYHSVGVWGQGSGDQAAGKQGTARAVRAGTLAGHAV
ncbi:MAG: 4-hydroxythreonine-4-phosphate dehydrogenase PdxA, partial [Gemmatimonadota bacterium]